MAERTGFEPAVPLLAHTLSKRAPSTTRPPLRALIILADSNSCTIHAMLTVAETGVYSL